MEILLKELINLHPVYLFLIFLAQNLLVFILALFFGAYMLHKYDQPKGEISWKEGLIAGGTVLINTAITYAGYFLWQKGMISIAFSFSTTILIDVVILFFVMDFLMYGFHFIIHHSFLHHKAIDPHPVDLFILHPLETVAFGGLWLLLLLAGTFNIWAILMYLILNVGFGVIGHLGFEPLRKPSKKYRIIRFIGTSSFHHGHHQDMDSNFGFYTSIWDRIFGTYADHGKQ